MIYPTKVKKFHGNLFEELILSQEKPTYEKIAQIIKDHILIGEFLEGDMIPGVAKMAEGFKTSEPTTSHALNALVKEKVLVRTRGIGWFVADGAVKMLREIEGGSFDKMIPQIVRRAKFLGRDPEKALEMIKAEFEK